MMNTNQFLILNLFNLNHDLNIKDIAKNTKLD